MVCVGLCQDVDLFQCIVMFVVGVYLEKLPQEYVRICGGRKGCFTPSLDWAVLSHEKKMVYSTFNTLRCRILCEECRWSWIRNQTDGNAWFLLEKRLSSLPYPYPPPLFAVASSSSTSAIRSRYQDTFISSVLSPSSLSLWPTPTCCTCSTQAISARGRPLSAVIVPRRT